MRMRTNRILGHRTARQSCLLRIETVLQRFSNRPPISPLAENLMTGAQDLWQPRLTPDGSEILYVATPQSSSSETLSSIFAIPVMGGTPRLVLQDINIQNVQCARLPSTICLYGISKGDTFRLQSVRMITLQVKPLQRHLLCVMVFHESRAIFHRLLPPRPPWSDDHSASI
jgi:hypothetical protein